MSIIESLKKVLDPEQARREDEERLVVRNLPQRDNEGSTAATYVCRVCGHEGRDKIFCPVCLAETMRKQD